MNTTEITATVVPENQRMSFMPMLFTKNIVVFGEGMMFRAARAFSKDYTGGHWEFIKLSNGSGYAHPTDLDEYNVLVQGNGFEGKLSADAFGIVCTMSALSEATMFCFLKEMTAANETCAKHYHQLREYLYQHEEAKLISQAID